MHPVWEEGLEERFWKGLLERFLGEWFLFDWNGGGECEDEAVVGLLVEGVLEAVWGMGGFDESRY